ncbi:MAG: N-acetyl sugar amidotransferase [Planctomycetota bacterium]|jgi:N-acetyl sugar amidotransferase
MTYRPLWSPEVEARLQAEARNLDKQERAAGPVQMCTRCVMTNQRPRIVFDEEGVCSACRYAERKRGIDMGGARGAELYGLLRGHRKPGYEVVIPCSGGKDSSFVASYLRDQCNMNVLCATWAPFIYTGVGWRNMQAFVQAGFDVNIFMPNGHLHRKLARLGLEFYGDPFLPFIYGQLNWPMHVAAQNDIGLVFFGENGEAEYGGDPSANDKPCWDEADWERVYMKGGDAGRLLMLGRELGCLTQDEAEAISPFYTGLEFKQTKPRPEFHWLGYYLPWHPQGNFYHAAEHTGFKTDKRSEGTWTTYASLDDKLDGLHYYMGYVKFGIGRCTSDAAHEIRDGNLGRDEALALVKKYDGELPARHLGECLDYLGMDRPQLDRVIARFSADSPT